MKYDEKLKENTVKILEIEMKDEIFKLFSIFFIFTKFDYRTGAAIKTFTHR